MDEPDNISGVPDVVESAERYIRFGEFTIGLTRNFKFSCTLSIDQAALSREKNCGIFGQCKMRKPFWSVSTWR
jgi:hypothetical protein